MAIAENPKTSEYSLRVDQSWNSFEQFRQEGANALHSVKNQNIATLETQTGKYRILEEQDFQTLYGLARDVERLRGGLHVVILAVRAAQKHLDEEQLNLLAETVAMVGNLPELPVQDQFNDLMPEQLDWDHDDEVILDPKQINRPLQSQKSTQPNLDQE